METKNYDIIINGDGKMISAILLAILASFLWGITNHIDKFMISGIDEGKDSIKILLVFSTFVAGIVLTPLWLILSGFNIGINAVSLISVFLATLYLFFDMENIKQVVEVAEKHIT